MNILDYLISKRNEKEHQIIKNKMIVYIKLLDILESIKFNKLNK